MSISVYSIRDGKFYANNRNSRRHSKDILNLFQCLWQYGYCCTVEDSMKTTGQHTIL